MKAHEMTFGVEIECYVNNGCCAVGGYHSPIQVPWLPRGWGASNDGSLNAPPAGKRGVEFVSPILRGREGMEQVAQVISIIKNQHGGEVNYTCGLHVHVGFDKHNYAVLAQLLSIVANHEKAIYAMTGTKARERGTYAKSIKQYNRESTARRRSQRDRFHVLNLATSRQTIEVRAFAGTLNPSKAAAHVAMCLGIVEKAFERRDGGLRNANWTQRTSATPDNEGQKEVERLLRALGWVGRNPKGTGMLWGETEQQRQQMLKAAVKVMRKMARKYDADR